VSHRERRTVRLSAVAAVGVLGGALLLGGCDNDGTGVEDAGSNDNHVDTALSSSTPAEARDDQSAPQPTEGQDVAPQPAPSQSDATPAPAPATVAAGSYQVPMGEYTLLCDFVDEPEAGGYAWACEAPAHLGWGATDGGEANAVAYRPGGDPEVYALLGNSGISPTDRLPADGVTTVGERYTVDATAGDAVTVTDSTTGAAVQLSADGYQQL
jgi:hypothetical protein